MAAYFVRLRTRVTQAGRRPGRARTSRASPVPAQDYRMLFRPRKGANDIR
jgi:hypothetical protein